MDAQPWVIWFFVGMGLVLAELALPGFILLFFGLGAWITALICLATPLSTAVQIALFLAFSLSSLAVLRRRFAAVFSGRLRPAGTSAEMTEAVGQTALVTQDIAPGRPGEIRFRGSFWRAVADTPMAKDTTAVIEAAASEDGLTFKVKPGGG